MLTKEKLRKLDQVSLKPDFAGFSKHRLSRFLDCDIREIPHMVRRGELPEPKRDKLGPVWSGEALRKHWSRKLSTVNKAATDRTAAARAASVNGGPPQPITMLSTEAQRSDFAAANDKRRRQLKRERAEQRRADQA